MEVCRLTKPSVYLYIWRLIPVKGTSLEPTEAVKWKLKCSLVQALRLCTDQTAHRGSGGIALLFLDHGTRRGWGVSVTPRPLFTPGNDRVPTVQEAGWAPGPVWTGAENLASTGIRTRTVQPVPSRYTDWDTGPTTKAIHKFNTSSSTIHLLKRTQNKVIFTKAINSFKTQEKFKYLKIPVIYHYINEEFKGWWNQGCLPQFSWEYLTLRSAVI